ncbi:MAG: DUF4493 domain-containing protein [Bacteroidales bacterium]|nr:DUF4493 domain-containing protein [Bacteroidales bacterium]
MKRSVAVGLISAIITASCTLLPENEKEGCFINLRFAQPVETVSTKAIEVPDTNSFILTIANVGGDVIYSGSYGKKPSEIVVPHGTYSIEVVSSVFEKPAFESPCFGDRTTIVASNGKDISVQFLCKMINSGVKINMKENFISQYGGKSVTVSQDGESLDYSTNETRFGYFSQGNAVFSIDGEPLFNKVLEEGKLLTLNIDASKESSDTHFSIAIDANVESLSEDIVVGSGYSGENGLSAATAFGIESAKKHIGDTVWVWGYIVGCYNGSSATSLSFSSPFESRSNLALSSSKAPSSNKDCFSVSLSTEKLKAALSLADNGAILSKTLFVKGVVEESYFGTQGIKKILDYELKE